MGDLGAKKQKSDGNNPTSREKSLKLTKIQPEGSKMDQQDPKWSKKGPKWSQMGPEMDPIYHIPLRGPAQLLRNIVYFVRSGALFEHPGYPQMGLRMEPKMIHKINI